MDQPPPFAFPSEASSALASESDLPYDSPMDQPSLSAFPSEADSAPASESDLLPLSSVKVTKQTGLLDFFSKMPVEEAQAKWQKRKQDNEERDREEYEERKRKDEVKRLHKQAHRREQNRLSQQKRRVRIKKDQAKVPLQDDMEQDSSVSSFCYSL